MTAISLIIPRQLKAGVWSCSTRGSRKQQSKLTWRGVGEAGTAHKLWPLAVQWLVVKLVIVFVVNHWLTYCLEFCGSSVLCFYFASFEEISLKKFPLFKPD